MNKKSLFICIILIISLLLSGCWNSRELNTIGISLVVGLDLEKNNDILLTVEIIKPTPSAGNSKEQESRAVEYVQGRGKSIIEAFRDITLKFDRRIFASHTKVFIFGEEFAKKGMLKYMDFLQRDHELRETAYILVAKDSKAYEVMGIKSGIEDIPANYVLQLIKNENFNSKAVDLNISEFLKYYYEEGLQPVVGIIEKKKKMPIIKENTSKKEYELSIEGAAVFKKEKLIGYLNGLETRGFNFLNGEVKGGLIQFLTPNVQENKNSILTSINDNKKSRVVVEVIRSKTKKDIDIINGKIVLKVNVVLKGMLSEVIGDLDVSKEEVIKEVERTCSLEIKREMEEVMRKVQSEYKIDIFSFAPIFHRKHPEKWQEIGDNWDDFFSEAKLDIEVDTDILRTGLINTPTGKRKGE